MRKKKLFSTMLAIVLAAGCLTGCNTEAEISDAVDTIPASNTQEQATVSAEKTSEETEILLSDDGITVNGSQAGTDTAAVYLSNDIVYYEDKDAYESGNLYGEGTEEERHSEEDALAHTVVNITEPGTYRISGQLSQGQIRVDLGEEASEDPQAVVTLILDNAELQCDVAPAILFMNVYECDNGWSVETAGSDVNTQAAGANLILADGSTNVVTGSHVARIYADTEEEKKLWKQDGAIYSYMSMNVDGEQDGTGMLNLYADNEGLDTELHVTINGGNLNIRSQNDGINTNEDGVSVTTINGGNIHIIAGLGEEGDGIESNGWLVINGGTVIASANPAADAGLDSDMGSYINGGTVVALGSTMDWAESDSEQVTMNLQFAAYRDSDSAIVVKDAEENIVFAYDPSMDEVVGENIRQFMGAVISSPAFAVEQNYTVYIGGEVAGTENAGVYDIETVTGYEGGVQQAYTGTDVMMGPGGMGMGGMGDRGEGGQMQKPDGEMSQDGQMQKPDGEKPDGEAPELPDGEMPTEGFQGGKLPEGELPTEGFAGGEKPEGEMSKGEAPTAGGQMQKPDGGKLEGEAPELPEGEMPTEGFPGGDLPEGELPTEGFQDGERPDGEMPQGGIGAAMPGGMGGMMPGDMGATGEANATFYMQDKVNCFSGVADIVQENETIS